MQYAFYYGQIYIIPNQNVYLLPLGSCQNHFATWLAGSEYAMYIYLQYLVLCLVCYEMSPMLLLCQYVHNFQKIFEPVVQPQPRPKEKIADDVKINYEGRDILNLMGNLTDPRWSYRPTVLPPNNPALFFANRSQYHRLGPYGTRTQYVKDSCRLCGFSWVVAATD